MIVHYLHGLDSFPRPERLNAIEALGHKVVALHLDYRNEPRTFSLLLDFARQEGAQFVVGSSLGGFLGFWVAEALGLPCLLFNPAMMVTLEEAKIPTDTPRQCNKRFVLLGDVDERVDPDFNWLFFSQPENQVAHQRVVRQMGLGHEIDEATFGEALRWAIE